MFLKDTHKGMSTESEKFPPTVLENKGEKLNLKLFISASLSKHREQLENWGHTESMTPFSACVRAKNDSKGPHIMWYDL